MPPCPTLKKHGRLHALRRISPLGLIRYDMARFEGDNLVNKEIITRYLTAEVEAQKQQSPLTARHPAELQVQVQGTETSLKAGDVHVFEVTPRQKREDLFKGEVWIDARTYLKVQESGYLVKNPSIFLKKVAFIRKYEIRDGISVPLEGVECGRCALRGQGRIDHRFHQLFDRPSKRAVRWKRGQ